MVVGCSTEPTRQLYRFFRAFTAHSSRDWLRYVLVLERFSSFAVDRVFLIFSSDVFWQVMGAGVEYMGAANQSLDKSFTDVR